MSDQKTIDSFIRECKYCCNRSQMGGNLLFCNEYQELCNVLAEQEHTCTMNNKDEGQRLNLNFD